MSIAQHDFTKNILNVLNYYFPDLGNEILDHSELLQYLNIKTKAANRGSKSRAALGNHYAIYVLIEDYLNNQFHLNNGYEEYEGAQFTALLQRQRELPFGSKLQNHALNHRLNEEFKKYFPNSDYVPIIRDVQTNRYWINENLIKITVAGREINIAEPIRDIIDAYVAARQQAFNEFMVYCEQMIDIQKQNPQQAIEFIRGLLRPNIDARVFEIVSYAILKEFYANRQIYWGWSPDELNVENLILYKTGRTNANDGGIDFVMKPMGRFFQVTETLDAEKYFLDIDKVQRYPMTFVVKSEQDVKNILNQLKEQATKRYKVKAIVQRYLECVEEVINIPKLMECLDVVINREEFAAVINEIILQSRLEFNADSEE